MSSLIYHEIKSNNTECPMESDYPTRAQKAKISGEIYLPSIWFNGDYFHFIGR